ncbi:nuclear transport factor 2 family protein [uncultured Cohaesibacter sp.]|uniref:nuclear transport factor 2 family protein n=1 Tax=uncultured Cohaesibacter sp. TaxID=1002546 RepID=UPI00292D2B67|nr:nuclear transport factor 2 family protein [uncultured Cohaesibacter sp.]
MKVNASELESELLASWTQFREALVRGDTDALRTLLNDDFTLGHMTGYLQPRQEWLKEIEAGEAVYHSIQDAEVTVHLETENRATIIARTITDATVRGAKGQWQMSFVTEFMRRPGGWVAMQTHGSTW